MKLGERYPLEGTLNTRDLGGYKTIDGHHVKWHRLIRTDALTRITPNDISFLKNELGARYDVDLRGENERKNQPEIKIPDCTYVILPVQDDLNKSLPMHPHEPFIIGRPDVQGTVDFLFRVNPDGDVTKAFEKNYETFLAPYGQRAYARFMRLCLLNKEGSVLFHCSDGKDRAGVGAALLLSALGVDRETIYQDYLKTNEYTLKKAQEREKYLREECHIENETVIRSIVTIAGVRRNWLEAVFRLIDNEGGIEKYLNDHLDFSKEDIEELKKNYLE